jgi:uncharacterized phiE125 gp8 family phage protein
MTTRLITAPSLEPVTLAEAKLQCRVDDATDDALITSLIMAAREQCEHILQRSLITQTWEKVLDSFPDDNDIELLNPSILTITTVKYIDATTATETTLAGSQYSLDKDSEPGWLMPANGVTWPATLAVANAVRVRYTAGYGATASDVPQGIKNWILLAVKELYDGCGGDTANKMLPNDFLSGMLDRYRVWSI